MLDRRTFLTATAAGSVVALAAPGSADALSVGTVLAKDLRVPWGVAFLPNGDALVTERVTGRVHRVSRHGGRHLVDTVAGVDTRASAGEGGLLGITPSPTFAKDRFVYLYLTTRSDNRVIRMTYTKSGLGDRKVLLKGIPRGTNHNGGRLGFSPGGHLFVTVGDSRDSSLAQDKHSLGGKILRINPDGSVPADNPFGNEVWTYGHRNVEGLAWDSRGRMWATEFGENTRDELNRIRKGHDYGWPDVEGGDGPGGYADPFVTWHPTNICSPSGVAISGGRAWVGGLAGQCLWSVRISPPHRRRKVRHLHHDFGRIRTVQKAPDGSLWITTTNRDGRGTPSAHDDRVIRLHV